MARNASEASTGPCWRVSPERITLLSEIEGQGDLAKKLHEIAGDKFRRLFTTVKSYQLAENFRAQAAALLPESKAEALVALCENESAPRVSFEAASLPLAAAAAA
jgi:hypothetical protein